jgi:predicted ribosomally synthesized peptide with nif11-like leader
MSQVELQRFATDLRSDAALRQEVDSITSDPLHTVVVIAQRRGYSFTLEEAESVIAAKARAPMSDSELDRVTGGIISPINAINSVANKIASWF